MIDHILHQEDGILELRPEQALEAADFKAVADAIDPYIERTGRLNGLIIQASRFPGWAGFSGLVHHLRFIRDHHRDIRRIAFVSDDRLLSIAPDFARHFVRAELRHFPAGEFDAARQWILAGAADTRPEARRNGATTH